MDVQDLPPLNALSLELATVLDEISGVGYQRATKRNGWIKEKHVLSDHYSRAPCAESPSLCASENTEVSGVDVDPVSLDRISGFSMFSAPLFRDRKDMDTDEVGSLGYSFGSNGSLFSTDMEYVDKVGGFDHALHSEAVEHTLPIDSFDKLAGLYQIPEETQDQLSGQVALKNVSQFVDHVAPMLSNKDVSALQSILERLNVKSEEQIIHLKHPDSFADERDDVDAEIIWITSEASSKTTDELKAVETASFVSDTFSISECVPEESSDAFDEDEIIWITASEELADINESRNKTGTARTAVSKAQSADYDHKQSLRVALECPGSSSDQDKSEFIWITSPEDDLTHVEAEPSTSKPLQTSYEDQSKSYKTTPTKPATKLSCKLYDFAGEEVIITPIVKKIPGSDYLPCLTKEHTTGKSMKTSDEDQSGTSAKQQDASSSSSPATTGKLHDFAGEDVIITPLVKDTEEDAGDGSDRNLSYTPEYPPFVNACYWKRPVSKNLFEDRKKFMQSCFARDSELSICNPDKFVKKNKGKTEQLDFKNSLKEVVLHLDRSVGFHEGYLKSPVTDESVHTEKFSVPYNSFLQNQNFYSLFKTMPSDSSIDDTYVEPKSTASETFDILNLEKSSGFYVIHDNSNEIRLKSSDHAVEESQYLSEAQKDSASTSAQGSTLLESSFENGASHIFQHHFHKEDNNKEMTASPARANESFVKQNLSDHMLGLVGKCSANQQNENFDDSEIRSRLQGNETIKDASIQSEHLSSVQPSACKDFIKPEEPVATKYVQNFHVSGNTPAALDNHTKDNSDYASLHSQQIHPSVSNLRGKDLKAEELCDKFCEMPSEDVFPTSSLLYSSYESNGVANESSSTDEVKKKKSARYWMKKIFIPKKFYKKNVKGIR